MSSPQRSSLLILHVLACALVLSGCVSTRLTGYGAPAGADPRTPADRIRFYETQRPTCEYAEIGHVTAHGRLFASWDKVLRKARERAHDMGGDAIVSVRETTRVSGAVISKESISTTERTSFSGTVIRFSKANCRE
jgi:hypothetical protein